MLNFDASSPAGSQEPRIQQPEMTPWGEQVPRFFMAGPRHTLIVPSIRDTVQLPAADPHALRAAMKRISQDSGPNHWVGALPFDNSKPCYLLRPRLVKKLPSWTPTSAPVTSQSGHELSRGVSNGETYKRSVEQALLKIENTQLEKVVLAQSSDYSLSRTPHVPTLLSELRRRNPEGTTYAMELPNDGGSQRLLVGSSPELLVSKRGDQVRCLPLAGSRRRSLDPTLDRRVQEELLDSAKDKAEHALLVDQLLSDLAPWVEELVFLRDPQTISTSTMWHLATPIMGRVKNTGTTSLDLAMALHPSAAVCGVPRRDALETIHQVESVPRGFYAGALGAMDENGDGEWIVTIRGAEFEDNRVRIFSGAGVISGSSPELEFQETEDKKLTMLQAIAAATRRIP